MNAQEKWKEEYRRAKFAKENYSMVEMWDILAGAAMYRREAALERKLAAAERTITAQAGRIKNIKRVAHSAVGHVGAANYPEREEEAHEWIDKA